MPRYHMNIRCQDGLTRDLEGTDFPSFEDAREDALFAAKEMLAEVLRGGGPLDEALGNSVEITDGEGRVIARVPFSDGAAANLKGLNRQGKIGKPGC